jgi:hypothetical protein
MLAPLRPGGAAVGVSTQHGEAHLPTAILDVWITNLSGRCAITNGSASTLPHAWMVAVPSSDGRGLTWSQGRYRMHTDDPWNEIPLHAVPGNPIDSWWHDSILTRKGHVEIDPARRVAPAASASRPGRAQVFCLPQVAFGAVL